MSTQIKRIHYLAIPAITLMIACAPSGDSADSIADGKNQAQGDSFHTLTGDAQAKTSDNDSAPTGDEAPMMGGPGDTNGPSGDYTYLGDSHIYQVADDDSQAQGDQDSTQGDSYHGDTWHGDSFFGDSYTGDHDTQTRIHIHYDTGVGNSIVIAGNCPGLSWDPDKASVTNWSADNIWQYSSTQISSPCEIKPLFQDGDNNKVWAKGPNYIVYPMQGNDIYPFFFSSAGSVHNFELSGKTVEVYLPPSYNELGSSERQYPLVFMQDGQNLFNPDAFHGGWQLNGSLDLLMTEGYIQTVDGSTFVGGTQEFIVAAPHAADDRIYEYTPSNASYTGCDASLETCGGGADDYLDFILSELKPHLESYYRVKPAPYTIAGSSLGGLLSLYACWSRTSQFNNCGIFSPSLWWNNEALKDQISAYTGTKKDIRFYLDAGTVDDGLTSLLEFSQSLQSMPSGQSYAYGVDLWCVKGIGHEHNELAWRARAPFAFYFLMRDSQRVHNIFQLPSNMEHCD